MAREATIEIEYIGKVLSVNHYKYKGGIYTRPEATAWMAELGWTVKELNLDEWRLPLKITVSGEFKDKRSCPDIHNLLKIICDSIEEVTNLNDRDFRTETSEPKITGTIKPVLWIKIEESEGGS